MTTYISILRGINVSGQNLIKMDALQKLYENLGFHNVTTYVQSGNVVFKGDDFELNSLEQRISRQIEKDFGFDVPVIVLTVDKLKQIIDNNPFQNDLKKEHSYLHVTFLSSNPDHYAKKTIESKKQDEEEISFSENAIYLYCPRGYGKTKLTNNFLEAKLKVVATTRNWKTTNELFKIAQQPSATLFGKADADRIDLHNNKK
ncbi:MAG: DUF1697 domain-containing protein [Bacteroidota bacterium]|nr:DUF1697 domain-containing protein [Bacteroidota bacterium]